MEIKTTEEIINIEEISLRLTKKKWVAIDDLIKRFNEIKKQLSGNSLLCFHLEDLEKELCQK